MQFLNRVMEDVICELQQIFPFYFVFENINRWAGAMGNK
jgi:hypothetical protein